MVTSDLEKADNTIVVRAVDGHGGFTESTPVNLEYSPAGAEEEEGAFGVLELGVILLALGLAILVTGPSEQDPGANSRMELL